MATREETYKQFGPMMIEALVRLVFAEINLIRKELKLPERTEKQGLDALDTEHKALSKYDWMNTRQ